MSHFIAIREVFPDLQKVRQSPHICEDNNEDDQERKENRKPLHTQCDTKIETPQGVSISALAFSIFISRRAFKASHTAGMTEIRIIAIMTTSKFCFTNGILPKKYPSNVNSTTHTIPPNTLYEKK